MNRHFAVRLRDVAEIERDGVAPSDIVAGTTYVGLEHVAAGGNDVSSATVGAGELGSSKFRFTSDHILYGKLRPYLAKIAAPDFSGVCSTDILPVRPGPRIEKRFLLHYLRLPENVSWAAGRATGVNLPRLSPTELADMSIPLPPLDEQRRIAAILDKADALRQKRKRALAMLDSLTRSIFLEMFGIPGETRSSTTQQVPLGEIAELINGDRSSNYPSGSDLVGSGILFLNTTNITPDGLDLTDANYITEEKFASLSRGKLAVGDIIVTLRGSLGQTAIFEGFGTTGFINAQMMIIRPSRSVDNRYLLQALQLDSTLAHLKRIGSGSAVPQLTAKQMSELLVPLPDTHRQQVFAARRSELLRTKAAAVIDLQGLEQLFASLQHRAFSDELDHQ